MVIKIISWIDRNYNILFHKNSCLKIDFGDYIPKYGDIFSTPKDKRLVCLGNNWFKFLEK